MRDNNMTAVEWLEEQLNKNNEILFISDDLLEQAKEMEKQQDYSEEEVIKLLRKALTHKDDGEIGSLVTAQGQIRTANFHSWFEQFKNK
jgi:uncharacterized protein (DUF3084 family)